MSAESAQDAAASTLRIGDRAPAASVVRGLLESARGSLKNVAVLGLGFMGSTHVNALASVPEARLYAVFSHDEKKLAGDLTEIRGNIGGPGKQLDFSGVRKYRDLQTLLDDPLVDSVDICLPTWLHAETAIAALRAGRHVLVEKPMALDPASAEQMTLEAEQAGRLLMTAHVLRFFPEYAALRAALSDLGDMRHATFRRECAAPLWGGWLASEEQSGGGAFDLLIHDADMALHLFGLPEKVSATGFVNAAAGIDVLTGTLHYADGRAVVIAGGWHHPGAFPFSMGYTVVADAGTLDYTSGVRVPTLYRREGGADVLPLAGHDGYVEQLRYFVRCCAQGSPPDLCPPRESARAVALMRLLQRARQSNGEKVECTI